MIFLVSCVVGIGVGVAIATKTCDDDYYRDSSECVDGPVIGANIVTILLFVALVALKVLLRPMAMGIGVQGSTNDSDFQFTLRSKKDSSDIENAIRRQQAAIGDAW